MLGTVGPRCAVPLAAWKSRLLALVASYAALASDRFRPRCAMVTVGNAKADQRAAGGDRWAAKARGGRLKYIVEFTAIFRKVPEGYVAYVEELPGANTQGGTLEEARENLREGVQLVLEANRELAREENADADVIREQLRIAVG